MTDTASLPAATRIGRATLRVNDLDGAVGFYRDVVGLAVRSETGGEARLGDGSADLLVLREDPDARARDPAEAGLFHVAFRVPTRAALADALDRIRGQWTLDGAADHRVSEALYLSDPEGNGVEVYSDRPRSEWTVGENGRVRMETLPLDLDDLAVAGDGASAAPEGTDVGHVHLDVSSIPATREFYAGTLGLRVRQMYGREALFLAAGDYHHHVGANIWRGRSAPRSARSRGLAWFELVVPTRDALDAAIDRFGAHDIAVTRRERGIEVADPDDIRIRLRVAD